MRFKPSAPMGDISITSSPQVYAIPAFCTSIRFVPEEDMYVKFGIDNTVTAVVGTDTKLLGGSIETLEVQYPQWTHFSMVSAQSTVANVTAGTEN